MKKISEIFRQRFVLKLTYREIANSLGIGIATVSDYLCRAKGIGISWPLPEGITDQELYDKLFLPVHSTTKKRIIPEWQYIHQELHKKGVTLLLLWREYREQHTNGVGYAQFCHLYQRYTKTLSPDFSICSALLKPTKPN